MPDFGYKKEHMISISQELIEHMMYNTLKIGVYGMIEAKKSVVKKNVGYNDDAEDDYIEENAAGE